MKKQVSSRPALLCSSTRRAFSLGLLCLMAATGWRSQLAPANAQGINLANPDWNITLTDFGYSDFLLDNTPGFEGREYLSGEWGAAVAYQPAGEPTLAPRFLEPQFLFPDWPTLSTFGVKSPLMEIGLNPDNLPIAQSVITNRHLEITLRHEMLDTVIGTPMGTAASSATGSGSVLASSRFVLLQTATFRNTSGAALTNLQFFQFLHGLQSERGVYDPRQYPGAAGEFHYDLVQAGVDASAVGPGSSSAGLEDFIAFHARFAPDAFEVGHYGIEGNGVDDHSIGKPSDGVHLSIENNWMDEPYRGREGTDYFAPTNRWISGAQRWSLGNLAPGQSTNFEVLLSIRTGTRVGAGDTVTGGCNGGSGVPGGLDYEFENVTADGSCFGEFTRAEAGEIEVRIQAGEFGPFSFLTPGDPAQIWNLTFSGEYAGQIHLTFGYDPTALPAGFDESTLALHQFTEGAWTRLPGTVDPVSHTLHVTTSSLSTFALGVEGAATYTVAASANPPNSGILSGSGPYAGGARATLVATPADGYVFAAWTEAGATVSSSPTLTFVVSEDRSLTAQFVSVGEAKAIRTASLPAQGGATGGDGAYALGATATVTASARPGYKFSKWTVNGTTVSSARTYSFTVTGDRSLTAVFKPVYVVSVTAEPPEGGEVEADPAYEAGELAKLKARPNDGWAFVEWTQNGVPISSDAAFQFNVTANRTLVGHFARGNRIDVLAEPSNAGFVLGGGVVESGLPVLLIAEPRPGYVFVNWTEDGEVVETASAYLFPSSANRALIAHFIPQPSLSFRPLPDGGLLLAWPAGTSGWGLQTAERLDGEWTDWTGPVDLVGSESQVTLPRYAGTRFFRLSHR